MKRRIFLGLATSGVLLAGCTKSFVPRPHASEAFIIQQLLQDHATKKEVYSQVGQPIDVTYSPDGSSKWFYFEHKIESNAATFIPLVNLVAAGGAHEIVEYIYSFNPEGRLENVRRNRYEIESTANWTIIGSGATGKENQFDKNVEAEMKKLDLPVGSFHGTDSLYEMIQYLIIQKKYPAQQN